MRDVLNPGTCRQCHLPLEYEGGFLGDDICYGCEVRSHKKKVRRKNLLWTLAIAAGLATLMISSIMWMMR